MHTVMVVDDEPHVREITARMLRESGYSTVELGDGQEAWNYLTRSGKHIDAILADVVMPRMTGTELVARLRYTYPDLPVLLLSAYSVDELRARGLDESPVPLLTKPFDLACLVRAVHSLLEVRAAR
jgi:CheY-like chemotaxis protein